MEKSPHPSFAPVLHCSAGRRGAQRTTTSKAAPCTATVTITTCDARTQATVNQGSATRPGQISSLTNTNSVTGMGPVEWIGKSCMSFATPCCCSECKIGGFQVFPAQISLMDLPPLFCNVLSGVEYIATSCLFAFSHHRNLTG